MCNGIKGKGWRLIEETAQGKQIWYKAQKMKRNKKDKICIRIEIHRKEQ